MPSPSESPQGGRPPVFVMRMTAGPRPQTGPSPSARADDGGWVARRRAVGSELRAADHLPRKLREALALACEGEPPIRTVERLAVRVGCDRRTLWNQWKQSLGRDTELRLQDFLHWLLLLRAAGFKTAELSWADVADAVGVHPHTLGRLARQLTGRNLRDLGAGSPASVLARFEAEILPRLLESRHAQPAPGEPVRSERAA
jgi:hypothetical protein